MENFYENVLNALVKFANDEQLTPKEAFCVGAFERLAFQNEKVSKEFKARCDDEWQAYSPTEEQTKGMWNDIKSRINREKRLNLTYTIIGIQFFVIIILAFVLFFFRH
jgi:hypothetical protein